MNRLPARHLPLLCLLALLAAGPAAAHGPNHGGEPAAAAPDATAAPETARRWGCPMCETVRQDAPGDCPLCRMALVPMEPSRSAGGSGDAGAGPGDAAGAGHETRAALMPGAPDWVFFAAALAVLLLSFVLLETRGRRRPAEARRGRRFDLLRVPGVRWMLKSRRLLVAVQLSLFALFTTILVAGFVGNPDPARNIAPALTWTLWWTWLAFVIVFLGKFWCTICPWMAIADWLSRIGGRLTGARAWSLERRWPKGLRNIWPATFLFVLLTWLELGYGVTEKPWLTATLGLTMVAAAVGTVLVFERKAFCRYACLVGRVSGLYSMFAATELRRSDAGTCRSCATKDCYHGNDRGDPCPTHQFLGGMQTNTYCTLCLECVKSCPEDNVAWNVRPPGADLVESHRVRVDEAYLAVIMLSMSAFHGLTMTPSWDVLVGAIEAWTGAGWLLSFSLGMALMILAPLGVYYAICAMMRTFARDVRNSTRTLFVRFAYSLLPIALFYHLAHNVQHVLFEGKKLLRLASDPFGWGWNLFGTADLLVDAVLPVSVGWAIQVSLILVGHVFGIVIAHRAAAALYADRRQATLSQIPMLVAMLLFSLQSLWLIAQPMVMRTAM